MSHLRFFELDRSTYCTYIKVIYILYRIGIVFNPESTGTYLIFQCDLSFILVRYNALPTSPC
jgi:hypothetical protein